MGESVGGPRALYQFVSDILVPLGIAVWRYDKRGTGESTGNFVEVEVQNSPVVIEQLANHALGGVRFLYDHARINPDQIGLLGFSQGAWINPSAAARSDSVAFIINVVGPAVSVGEEIFYCLPSSRSTSFLRDWRVF